MATSPQRRHIERPSPLVEKPPERRQTSAERGYTWTWAKLAEQERKSRTFCELCMAMGVETACGSQITLPSGRKKSEGVIDHVIPVGSDKDDLFWCEANWWLLCDVPKTSNNFTPCNSWKSTHFDGTYGKSKIVARSRDLDGVRLRKAEIIEARRKARLVTQDSFG